MSFTKQQRLLKSQNQPFKASPKWFYLTIILIPIIFFIILEIALRIFHYGFDNRQWIDATENKLFLNPEIAKRYFYTTERIPTSNGDVFDAVKKTTTFRVFVLGESSAAGYPFLPLGSFSHYIRKRLELVYPYSKIEVINLGLTAVNSYTIRDLFPGVVEQKPDLVLIYTGHNEYYGALGAGSMESLGTSRTLVNLLLYLNKYKTVELLRNSIKWIVGIFSSPERKSGTLMSRMAKEQSIELGSETYFKGLSQFEGNMRDVLKIAKEKNIPVILSTLTSNLRDQRPFISIKSEKNPSAQDIYEKANTELMIMNYQKADSLFRLAKDLDGLRFRAPEEINSIIKTLSKEFNIPLVEADSSFETISPQGIVGNNLMTDHLHPTLQGYQYLGKLFYDKMEENNYLPSSKSLNITNDLQDSIVVSNYNFTGLDSVLGELKIRLLKNDWPFIDPKYRLSDSQLFNLNSFRDSLAYKILADKISWEEGHRTLAAYFLQQNDIEHYLKEIDALITQYPVVVEYYDYVAKTLIQVKNYSKAYKYLQNGYDIKPNAFKTKWLGTINLYNNNLGVAEKYLNESLLYDGKDSQLWYNLAGVYVKKNNYAKALEKVNKALELNPKYLEAANLQKRLKNAVKIMR